MVTFLQGLKTMNLYKNSTPPEICTQGSCLVDAMIAQPQRCSVDGATAMVAPSATFFGMQNFSPMLLLHQSPVSKENVGIVLGDGGGGLPG